MGKKSIEIPHKRIREMNKERVESQMIKTRNYVSIDVCVHT
jgi:hypothetical protein